ncbi:MAG: ribonuclease HII [Zymomonas mobilis]|nr:ribonuclease HII [Zymomonas mobilis]
MPDLSHEDSLKGVIFGVDEVGRGPLAGPVMAGAVYLHREHIPQGINDSKKLTPRRRHLLSDMLHNQADYATGLVDVETIDRINIRQASLLAMRRAVEALIQKIGIEPDYILVDGRESPDWPWKSRSIIRGDSISLSIAAASIVAKVERDEIMTDASQQYPGYGWERNMGYGTREHREAIQILGPTPLHRQSFAPVRYFYENKN